MLPPTLDLMLNMVPKMAHISQITPSSLEGVTEAKSKFQTVLEGRLNEIDRSLPLKKRFSKALKIQRVIDRARQQEISQNSLAMSVLDQVQSQLNQKINNFIK